MLSTLLSVTSLVAVASAHSVILNAQGIEGSPASVAFQVDPQIARNCTSISPCQQDTTIIRDQEIAMNIVNECGRTQLSGNIDIGENTENAIAANAVTKVAPGTQMAVTVHVVNADGAGPYFCDLEESGNTGTFTQNLTVEDNVPGANGLGQIKFQAFDLKVTMPDNFTCTGASTGNICTVRCRNAAQAGPFGGCFPVEQDGATAQDFQPAQIPTAADANKISKQTQQNNKDIEKAKAIIVSQGAPDAVANVQAVSTKLQQSVAQSSPPVQTPDVDFTPKTATETAPAAVATAIQTKAAATSASASATSAKASATAAAKGKGKAGGLAALLGKANKRSANGLRWAKRASEESS